MKLKYIYPTIGILLFLFTPLNCKNYSKGKQNINEVQLDLADKRNTKLISENLDITEIIVLETLDSSLIRNIKRIIIHNDSIIILNDREEILIFDSNGKFIDKIRKRGRGPGEYNNIVDITIDKKKDHLFIYADDFSLLVYDLQGNFLSKISGVDKDNLYERIMFENNRILLYNPLGSKDENIIRIYDLSSSDYIKNRFNNKTVDFILRQQGVPIVKSKSIWYVVPLDNLLLNSEGNITYRIKTNNFGISKNMLEIQYSNTKRLIDEINEKQICYGFSSIRETNKAIYFKSNIHDLIILNKKNNRIEWNTYLQDEANNINNLIYFPHDGDDNKIMFIITDRSSFKNLDILDKYSNATEELVNEEQNPILVFYKEQE